MQNCKELEQNFSFSTWLTNLSQFLSQTWSQVNELKVWQKVDRYGETYWKVYNPMTNQTLYFGNEEEVLAWIEQCYYP